MSAHQFTVGGQVVCVDDEDNSRLHAGNIYTVAAISIEYGFFKGLLGERPCLILKEIKPVRIASGEESDGGFAAVRFRPVQKRKTNISIFTAMLTKTTVPA